jgi:hypothetical protein
LKTDFNAENIKKKENLIENKKNPLENKKDNIHL